VLRSPAPPALHVRQRPGTDPRCFRELLQRKARRVPVTTQRLPEARRFDDRRTTLSSLLPDQLERMKA
jgi:hypothetical protein